MHPSRSLVPAAALGLSAVLGLTACSSGQSGSSADSVGKVTGKISLTYLQKQGDQQYFIDEAAGAKAKAAQLGVDLKVVNLGTDANRAVGEAQAAIAQKTNGLIAVLPDPSVGPQVVQSARDAKIALLTSDDQVCATGPDPAGCAHQDLLPRVGFSGDQMGQQVGQKAAALFKSSGWDPSDTRIISAWQQDVTVCSDRVKAADEQFAADGTRVQVIDVPTDNTPTGAQDKVAATLTANPGVKHWIIWGCNDENVQGGVTAMQNAGISPDNIIGVGLGAYLACKDWAAGKPSGMKAALFINGKDVGALAVQTMYDKLRNGTDFPPETFAPTTMVDASNWQSSGMTCT
ncbi:substrate-binding domain-containing protein [Kitasatospora viridis]|uniref:L-arabinose transport system substrate-binding protein n=1 Tax=Kitasatospora viridis TaxID=281105 RepID=A0A561T7I5_9ACTN|nr:substrate-binding domain-containing protein [Kitasatospora viridis]TWF83075.1 L-arabinose transport system substrate-binding protein [Kitasatospora viridis]